MSGEKYCRITVTTTDAVSQAQQRQPFSGVTSSDRQHRGHYSETTAVTRTTPNEYSGHRRTTPYVDSYRRSRPSHPWDEFRFPSATVHPHSRNPPKRFAVTSDPLRHQHMTTQDHASMATSTITTTKTSKKKKPRLTAVHATIKIPAVISVPMGRIEPLGPAHLQVFKMKLPFYAADTFQRIIDACEDHARHQLDQWETNLYSLTKQDIAVADVPGGPALVQGIQDYVVDTVRRLYRQPVVHMDRNQPHVLKYDAVSSTHRSVPLHHDRCHGTLDTVGLTVWYRLARFIGRLFANYHAPLVDYHRALTLAVLLLGCVRSHRPYLLAPPVTVNMMMSASTDYKGGGTYLVDLDQRVMLEQGEFLLHPGHLVHAGCEITAGTRYIMVFFVHFPPPPPPLQPIITPASYFRCSNMHF
jgi:hypothetical protein